MLDGVITDRIDDGELAELIRNLGMDLHLADRP
jgi:hypothetical protein